MKKRFTEEQNIKVLKEAKLGAKVADVCRKYGVSQTTYYKWHAKYSGLEVNDLRRLKQLEDENRRLKNIVADQALNIQVLDSVIKKY